MRREEGKQDLIISKLSVLKVPAITADFLFPVKKVEMESYFTKERYRIS